VGRRPDAVLLIDLHIGEGAGFSSLGPLLQSCPARIVVMSFSNSEEDRLLAIHFGANAFLDKTPLMDELIPTIKMLASQGHRAEVCGSGQSTLPG
jgi:DNA-binding response OmpR family regulator